MGQRIAGLSNNVETRINVVDSSHFLALYWSLSTKKLAG